MDLPDILSEIRFKVIERGEFKGREFGIWELINPISNSKRVCWAYGNDYYWGMSPDYESALLEVIEIAIGTPLLRITGNYERI